MSGIDDCWNRIGVRGDSSCPELLRHIHCRNCPVYSSAALNLLDREAPAGYIADWTRHFARPKPPQDLQTQSALVFRVGAEWLGLPASVVKEVAEVRPVHPLPNREGGVLLGLINVRGELLACVSLGRLLGLDESPGLPETGPGGAQARLVVMSRGDVRAVCRADEVSGIHRFDASQLKAVPATVAKAAASYSRAVVAWNGRSLGLLDDQVLFHTILRSLA